MVTARLEPPSRRVRCAPRFWCLVGASPQPTAADHYDRANERGQLQPASPAADERALALRSCRAAVGHKMYTRNRTSAIHTSCASQMPRLMQRRGAAAATGGSMADDKSRQLEPANLSSMHSCVLRLLMASDANSQAALSHSSTSAASAALPWKTQQLAGVTTARCELLIIGSALHLMGCLQAAAATNSSSQHSAAAACTAGTAAHPG